MKAKASRTSFHGFSLMELLAAMAVMSLIIILLLQLIKHTTATTTAGRIKMDVDNQARSVFERIAIDLAAMPKRRDIDFLFYKHSGNDKIFFFSRVPGTANSSGTLGSLSLVGYRISSTHAETAIQVTPPFQLERMSMGLTWAASQAAVFLTGTSANSYAPLTASTIPGNPVLSDAVGSVASYYDDGASTNYTALSDAAFRFEFCYFLKNGVWSDIPVYAPNGIKSNLGASAPPTMGADSDSGYAPGSRWYDTNTNRAYICNSAISQSAVWQPLGLDDVAGITIAIAYLDQSSRKTASSGTTMMASLITQLADSSDCGLTSNPPTLMAQTWQTAVDQQDFAIKAGGNSTIVSRIHIYQRYFKLAEQ